MNISYSPANEETLAELFRLLAQPARLQILLALGAGEACVCHLEALFGLRQAHISQHLMALRSAGLVSAHRDGRNIFYRLEHPHILSIIQYAAEAQGLSAWAADLSRPGPVANCPCPRCALAAGVPPAQARQITCDPHPAGCNGPSQPCSEGGAP